MKKTENEVLYDKDGNEVFLNNKKKGGCLKWFIIAIGVIILFTACNILVLNDDTNENTRDDSTSIDSTKSSSEKTIEKEETVEDSDEKFLSVGETVTLEDIEVTIHDAQLTDFRREYADRDYKNVLWLDATVKNNSDKDIVVQTLFEGYVNNKEVELYRTDDNNITGSGPLRSGREIEGNFAFAFDEDADKFELVFSPFLSDLESIFEIDLK